MSLTGSDDATTSERIFRAAAEVFEEKGYDGARMQEIADRASINKALLHYYYRSKEQLFRAVYRVLLKKMFEKTGVIFNEDLSFAEKIRRFLDEHIEFLIKNPRLPLFLLNEMTLNPGMAESLMDSSGVGDLRERLYKRHMKELREYGITKRDLPQLMVTIVSLAVFPVVGSSMLALTFPELKEKKKFNRFMRERKEFASTLLLTSLKQRGE